jgi:bifunctional UDP-N-acetylglucosamine pyrophosphorylase/glucosamine-1-phosphate N-acetyltransferase
MTVPAAPWEEKGTMQRHELAAIVLAAGQGKRMQSDLAKVLHPVLGRPMLDHVLDATREAGVGRVIVIVGHQAERVREAMAGRGVEFALQAQQRGTGHAVMQAAPLLADHHGDVLVLCGDTPLLTPETLAALLATHRATAASATVLTAELEDPTGYGRILRGADGAVRRIVEHKDATEGERRVREINSGLFAFATRDLFDALAQVGCDNAQGEYYLTDTLEILLRRGKRVSAHRCSDPGEVVGVNTLEQLQAVEAAMRERAGHG